MKLGIVIPLKSKKISRDWSVTTGLLSGTLKSIQAQLCKDFVVAVAGHEIPDGFSERFPEVKFLAVDIPVPNRNSPDFSHKKLIEDKNLKIAHAMCALKEEGVSHWYGLDSDDLLANTFVGTVLDNIGTAAGAVLEGGYFLYHDISRAIKTDAMTQYCGSTSIIADEFVVVPDEPCLENINSIPWSRYPHMIIHEFFNNEIQKPFSVIKEPILGYVLASGDNISDRWRDSWWKATKAKLKPFIKGQKYTKLLISTFSLDR